MSNVPALQTLLFPDPQPLVERLGREFFRRLPECPGVYLMRDESDAVLYVGKAKNLKKRLGSYRVANPDRMPRRHLRMLRAVARIELQECPNEPAALARESELLRSLRPRFNRAGTWPAPPRYLVWRRVGEQLELAVTETPEPGWQLTHPLGGGAGVLRAVLVRLLWCVMNPGRGVIGLPAGWVHGRIETQALISCGELIEVTAARLGRLLLSGQPDAFCEWVKSRLPPGIHTFEKAAVEADIEFIEEAFPLTGDEKQKETPDA